MTTAHLGDGTAEADSTSEVPNIDPVCPPPKWRMAFNSRRASIIEAAGIATLFLSVALIASVLFSNGNDGRRLAPI